MKTSNSIPELLKQVEQKRLGFSHRNDRLRAKENVIKHLKLLLDKQTDRTVYALFWPHFNLLTHLEHANRAGFIKKGSSLDKELREIPDSLIDDKVINLVEELQKETLQDDATYKLPRRAV